MRPTAQIARVRAMEQTIVSQDSVLTCQILKPYAAQHVMGERPGVAQQHQLADQMPEQRVDEVELRRAHGRSDQPGRKQQRAEIECHPGEPMHDRHHHVDQRFVDRQVRGKRTLDRLSGLGHGCLVSRSQHHPRIEAGVRFRMIPGF